MKLLSTQSRYADKQFQLGCICPIDDELELKSGDGSRSVFAAELCLRRETAGRATGEDQSAAQGVQRAPKPSALNRSNHLVNLVLQVRSVPEGAD